MVKCSRVDLLVGSRIRAALEMRGITPATAASRLGVEEAQFEAFCDGRQRIGPARLFQLSGMLGVEIGWFYRDVNRAVLGSGHADGRPLGGKVINLSD